MSTLKYITAALVVVILAHKACVTSTKITDTIQPANQRTDSSLLARSEAVRSAVGDFLKLTRSTRSAGSQNSNTSSAAIFHVQVTAVHVDKAEFPLSKLMFELTLRLALDAAEARLTDRRVKLSLNLRSANTCSHQFAGAVAAEEYYLHKTRLFIVSGCDDAIRAVSSLASRWQVPVMTAAGFGVDLNDKSTHKTLVRVAFSLQPAVEFLIKLLKSFQWQRVNMIVDESDANSLALKESIQKHLVRYQIKDFRLNLNVIPLDLQTLTSSELSGSSKGKVNSTITSISAPANHTANNTEDVWPNDIADAAVRDALRQSSFFSRVNIVLIPQQHLRKFMLSAHDQDMAHGLYTFISMPLLLLTNDQGQVDNAATTGSGFKQNSYFASTGENVFIWRSLLSSRNAQARQAFESLMSIYLRNPTTKAYVYFASKLLSLANSNFATTTTTQDSLTMKNSKELNTSSQVNAASKIQLSINPYTASFYDCLQIYASLLDESLAAIKKESNKDLKRKLKSELNARISSLVRNRRFDNMVTGTILMNDNGDRVTDYTLDDLNQLTGKFAPVILYKGESREIERLARIHWSSDETVGPTIDTVECYLTGTCPGKHFSKFSVTFMLLATPLALVMGTILYFVYNRINLESQLVDYWWKINYNEIELISTRRKGGSSIVGSATHSSAASSRVSGQITAKKKDVGAVSEVTAPATTTITRATDTSGAFASSAPDVCYGDINLGIYKLAKVALKPISKFHQSRKLMIELRTIKGINHNNLCRFVGIVVDEPYTALVGEFCPKGSLREFFQNESMVIDWTFKYSIINDIVAGLQYLHSSLIGIHGRLKSSNCLVSSRFIVKLSDYGLHSLHERIDDNEEATALMRKQIFKAPEHLKSTNKTGSKKGDVYSLGLLLYEIITNNHPFYNAEKSDYVMPLESLFNELKSSGPSEKTGPDLSVIDTSKSSVKCLVDLVKQCLQYDLTKRPTLMVVSSALKGITRGVTSKKLLENLTSRMEQYTNNLESLIDAKLATLVEEKQKTEELLYQFVPKSIASLLKEGQTIEPEAFDCVTVFYSDIVGFTSLSSESSPIEVIDFLSELYQCFDETLEHYDIFKVDTIGDAYIVASGLPLRNEGKHVIEIARAALDLRERLASFKIPHKPGRSLQMRVGIHSGPCIAGIVGGLNMPKYCVFGDTISTGKFMESSGQPMKIHVTEESKNLLQAIGRFEIEPRVPKINKDGLPFQTYWLNTELI